jgi:N-acetylglutamate synthase-like GNAT family acetyltransferase
MRLRKALFRDEAKVRFLLRSHGLEEEFLPEEFTVAEEGDILGCVRLKRIGDVYELCSLAAERSHQRKGVGKKLIKPCLAGVEKPVYCLTSVPKYFMDKGFEQVDRCELPSELMEKARYCNGRKNGWAAMVRR